MKNVFRKVLLVASMLLVSTAAMAGDALLKPFVLASQGPGTVAEKATAAKAALAASGFTLAGEYSPYPDADILVVTDDELKNNAAQSEHGGFGAIQRVAITRVGDNIQVSYTNPLYMANAYRMKGDLHDVAAKLQARERARDLRDAYALLSPDGRGAPHASLVIVGDGPERGPLEERSVGGTEH